MQNTLAKMQINDLQCLLAYVPEGNGHFLQLVNFTVELNRPKHHRITILIVLENSAWRSQGNPRSLFLFAAA